MTALKKYQKLECTGLWRSAPGEQRREVVVNFGEASLIMSDPRTEQALSHWSLPAVERLNPGERPALYAPGADSDETLEIEDGDMIAALDTVHEALVSTRPHPGRLRTTILAGASALILTLGIFWLPGALVDHTVAVVPPATRAEIGRLVLADMIRLTGKPCAEPLGRRAADRLARRLFGEERMRILVVRDGVRTPVYLPNRQILFGRTMVETAEEPEVLAGHALALQLHARQQDPLIPVLEHAGLTATFRLLTTGTLPSDAVQGYSAELLQRAAAPLSEQTLIARFEETAVAATPYAFELDPTGESVLDLIEADDLRRDSVRPVLTDEDWVSLQGICAD
ncbi:hypothetical protein LV780_01215 [Cereibacter azotoformans]|uniref:Peptidase M48 domain-containing protein n=2 Tax=Cereibacter TaxID=1653176 RepID=A0A2T5KEP1_9RHOB|nr:hypothetical protein [Cereibacter azotoformans]AXQ92555.1 hypothetical protein D0Z66_01215 [Cereibacter sphaeroides]MBO4169867.1 hypothetical protein [Cereibacter azotoformans]PTR20871.1 hypothetical protein C8J28_101191 [Cereibacter azotoformans]UIJ30830.1 hypothetical protein LV780_01215 [Cereibacter azotoformans]